MRSSSRANYGRPQIPSSELVTPRQMISPPSGRQGATLKSLSTPGEIRTPDPQVRSLRLYPLSYKGVRDQPLGRTRLVAQTRFELASLAYEASEGPNSSTALSKRE